MYKQTAHKDVEVPMLFRYADVSWADDRVDQKSSAGFVSWRADKSLWRADYPSEALFLTDCDDLRHVMR